MNLAALSCYERYHKKEVVRSPSQCDYCKMHNERHTEDAHVLIISSTPCFTRAHAKDRAVLQLITGLLGGQHLQLDRQGSTCAPDLAIDLSSSPWTSCTDLGGSSAQRA
jgi:hypothetical protein